MEKYDVVIIGSGMGGLACGNILSRFGKKVLILEKNNQVGGNLQVFSRDKTLFDTGVHYIGGLDEGQNLYKLFKYFGILDNLKLLRMDEDGFDRIYFNEEERSYKIGMGYDNYIQGMIEQFPGEEEAIRKYCDLVQEFCSRFPLYSLSKDRSDYIGGDTLTANAIEVIHSLTDNDRLAHVMGGNNALIAGTDESPFYAWALVFNSYIESSYKCVNGGSQIAVHMQRVIRSLGGDIWKRAEVVKANFDEATNNITSVTLKDGREVTGDIFISNIHPKQTIELMGEDRFRKAYRTRINSLRNSVSSFTLHVTFKENTFPYLNYNVYQVYSDEIWKCETELNDNWPDRYMLSTPAHSADAKFAEGASVMCYMDFADVEQWADTYNIVSEQGDRGEAYEKFKDECCKKVIEKVNIRFPNFKDSIKNYYASTPLTFRDYIGNDDGSLYGIMKNSNDGVKTYINPKTRIPNLLLTGANLNLHGLLGVSISAIVTCSEIIDRSEIIDDIEAAQ